MHNTVLVVSFALSLVLGYIVFGFNVKRIFAVAGLWLAGLVIASCFVLEAPLHIQYDDYQHYDYAYFASHPSEITNDVKDQNKNYIYKENEFIFIPPLKILGFSYGNMFFYMKFLYILMAPLALMCAWLLFRDYFASVATGVLFLSCPVLIRYAGSPNLGFPALCLYLVSVLFLLLFIDRRQPFYVFLSVPLLFIIAKTKTEHFFFIPAYLILAIAASKMAAHSSKTVKYPFMAIIAAAFVSWLIFLGRFQFGLQGLLFSLINERVHRISSGYDFRGFLSHEFVYVMRHAFIIPPVVFVKIVAIRTLFSKKHRLAVLALAAHALLFFGVYAASYAVESSEQYRFAVMFCFPVYLCAGLGFSLLREKKTAFILLAVLTFGMLIYQYALIPRFKATQKYREFVFLKKTLPETKDCTVLYFRKDYADQSPAYPLWALGNPKKIVPIQSVVEPNSALNAKLILFNKHRGAASFLLANRNTDWIKESSLQAFLYSIRGRDLSKENIDRNVHDRLKEIQRYVEVNGAKLPEESDSAGVWKKSFADSLNAGNCYYFYFSNPEQMENREGDEPFNFIRPYFEFGRSYGSGDLSLRRIIKLKTLK